MRKLFYVLIVVLATAWSYESYGQMNRRQIVKNSKRQMKYRGKKFGFSKEKRYNAIGITLNALNYYGDLAPKPSRLSTDIGFTRPAFGLSFSHRFGPRYTLAASFMYGTLKGSDAESADKDDMTNGVFRYRRNLSFRNRIKELSIVAMFDLFENQSTYISRVSWTPYAYAGIAIFHHNPQAQVPATDLSGVPFENAGQWVDLQPLGTEGQYLDLPANSSNSGIKPYKRIQPAIPFGIGARFRLNEIMDLGLEVGFRYLFTDYIDDVSRNYIYVGAFEDELTRALSYRTNELATTPPKTPRTDDLRYPGLGPYDLVDGYGHENGLGVPPNKRGDNDKDIYTVISIRFGYIIGKTFHRAKFR